jgi:Ni,Fe-hydrogenase I large subunit
MTRIAIDRHLHVDVEIDNGRVTEARLSSTMFRGIETILKGRDPRDAWAFAQRICGACTTSHAIASVRAVENAVGAVPPPNARLLRNLIMAAQTILVSTGMTETLERFHALLGGKHPHLQSFLVGGMATPIDPDRGASLNARTIAQLRALVARAKDFVDRVYLPAVLAAPRLEHGGNFLACGEYAEDDTLNPLVFLPAGVLRDGKLDVFDASKISETSAKYSWIKAPRYGGEAMEVGPLARMLVAYASGQKDVKAAVDALGVPLDRALARAVEARLLAARLVRWLDELSDNVRNRELRIVDNLKWEPASWPKTAEAIAFHEAPRGALMHRVRIEDRKIADYDVIAPATWNGSPLRGPVERALLGAPAAEIANIVNSFNLCDACGAH